VRNLTIFELYVILDEVEARHLTVDPRRLQSNPVLNAAQAVFKSLRAAIDEVCLRGEAFLEQARNKVVAAWEVECDRLKEKAGEALDLFQRMVTDLIRTMMEAIASVAPVTLKEGTATLDQFSFKMTLSASPSVGLAAQEVLRLAASAGIEIHFIYKLATGMAKAG
jgi:hypothetical protein